MKLIIAEKPSVAGDIAKYIGANNKSNGHFKGNDYCVTWAYGHLIEIADFKVQGYGDKWSIDNLPFIPPFLKKGPKNDPGAKAQLAIIKNLMAEASEVICATDAGREGELIFRYIYNYCGIKIPIKRLWVSSLTDEAFKEGFSKLQSGEHYQALYNAAQARNEADYIVGINATIALTVKSGSGMLLSLGRVQTPTLAIVCKRYIDHTEFVKTPYWELLFHYSKDGIGFKGQTQNKYLSAAAAQTILDTFKKPGIVKEAEKKSKKENAPKLFDLTELQRFANTKVGFTAQKTLDVMQSLYEKHKILTYPRTNSQYLSTDMKATIPNVFESLLVLRYSENSIKNILSKELTNVVFNNEKVTDHHAIIPTTKKANLTELTKDELSVYMFVVNRFIEAFSDPCEKDVTKITIDMGSIMINVTGSVITHSGWRSVSQDTIVESEDNDLSEDNQVLPPIAVGDLIDVNKSEIIQKSTSPPPLLNDSSLLRLMATAGKLIDDEELSDAIKDTGIGTTATRSNIIEILVNRKYIERKGKQVIPTEMGLSLYKEIKDLSICHVELTGLWEQKLFLMEKGNYSPERFKNEINQYINDVVGEIKVLNLKSVQRKNMGTCPKCNTGTLNLTEKSYSCSEYKNGCEFTIWLTVNGKKLTDNNITELLENKQTSLIKGFSNKEGKKYDAFLKLDPITFKMGIKIPSENDENVLKCPKCKTGAIRGSEFNFYCSRFKDGCDFKVYRKIAEKKLTDSQLIKLITTGSTQTIKGFKSKAGKEFDAQLKMTDDFKVEFNFPK